MKPRLNFKTIFPLLKATAKEWSEDNAPRLGAALAYYTVFSIAPLLIIAITITGLIFANAQEQVVDQVKQFVGDKGAQAVQSMIAATQKPEQSLTATILGFATLFFGAAGVFVQLKGALNSIWDVPESKQKGGIMAFVKKYFLSFGMVLGLGFLLLVSLLLETGMAIAGKFLKDMIPGMGVIMPVAGVLISFGIVTLLFAMMFKFLPDVKVAWHDVWIGAVLTAALFAIGKIGLGFYLGKAATASAYGAAGSLVILLLWVYYSSQILFFGAEFTQVFSKYHGSRCTRETLKEKLSPKERLVAESDEQRQKFASTLHKIFDQPKPPARAFPSLESRRHRSL